MQLSMALHRTADSAELSLGATWRSIEINSHHFLNHIRKLKTGQWRGRDGPRRTLFATVSARITRKMKHLERRQPKFLCFATKLRGIASYQFTELKESPSLELKNSSRLRKAHLWDMKAINLDKNTLNESPVRKIDKLVQFKLRKEKMSNAIICPFPNQKQI